MEPRDGDTVLPFGRSPRCVSCGWCYECVIWWAGQPAKYACPSGLGQSAVTDIVGREC